MYFENGVYYRGYDDGYSEAVAEFDKELTDATILAYEEGRLAGYEEGRQWGYAIGFDEGLREFQDS